MPSKKATKRTIKPTKAEREAATGLQAPSMRQTARPAVGVAFDVFKKKINEGRYGDEPAMKWAKTSDLIDHAFYVHRTFLYKSEYGKMVGFEITVDEPGGDRYLYSLSANDERTAFHRGMVSWRRENKSAPYIGPIAIELIESENPAHKPYVRFVEFEGDAE